MRGSAFFLLLLSAVPPTVDVAPDCGLELRVGPDDLDLITNRSAFAATLTNTGSRALLLVLPGDGSQKGDRTPLVEWRYTPRASAPGGFCGNINSLRSGEVFTLEPGESRELGMWAAPSVQGGVYRARMVYSNEPTLQWGGIPLGEHDRGEMRRVRRSDRCSVASNEINVRGYR